MSEQLDPSTLAACTTGIVAAYVSANTVAHTDLSHLIDTVARNLGTLGVEVEPAPEKPKPAVSIKQSVKNDRVICLICGKSGSMLKRHLHTAHELTPDGYRQMFRLDPDYPMVAPDYAEKRSKLAKKIGLGQKKQITKKAKPKAGRKT